PVEQGVGAVGEARSEAPDQLVLAPGSRLEAEEASADDLVHSGVEADVEVKERMFLEAPPVAAVEHLVARQIEGAGHHPLAGAGLDQLDPVAEALQDPGEEVRVQVPVSPGELVHRARIETEGLLRVRLGQGVTPEDADLEPLLG